MRGTLGELAAAAADGGIPARGEFVLVVGMAGATELEDAAVAGGGDTAEDRLAQALAEVERQVAEGAGRSEAARRVAAETGIPRRQLYAVRDAR